MTLDTLGGTGGTAKASATTLVTGPSPAAPPVAFGSAGSVPAPIVLGETTAELPALGRPIRAPRASRERAYGVLLPDGTVWYPDSPRRLPAPFALRLFVWVLLFILILGLVGIGVERVHPNWLDFARRQHTTPIVVPSGPASSPRAAATSTPGGFRRISATAGAITYQTGTSSFTIELTFANPVWTVVVSPANSKNYLVEQTLPANASPKRIVVNGSASVDVSAATEAITILSRGKTIGTITKPSILTMYSFVPSAR